MEGPKLLTFLYEGAAHPRGRRSMAPTQLSEEPTKHSSSHSVHHNHQQDDAGLYCLTYNVRRYTLILE
jgi:hypothetical protein